MEYGWEREYAGKKYCYVLSTIDEESGDMLLTVLCNMENGKKEIVKIYYLIANYEMQFSLQ